MNSSDQETIILTTQASQYSITPGGALEIPVILTNQGSAQDRLRIRVPLLLGTAITMQFKQGELTGFSGCNTYHGDYNATANGDGTNTIDIGQLQTSHLTCLQDIMQQEQTYLEILQQANQARNQEN